MWSSFLMHFDSRGALPQSQDLLESNLSTDNTVQLTDWRGWRHQWLFRPVVEWQSVQRSHVFVVSGLSKSFSALHACLSSALYGLSSSTMLNDKKKPATTLTARTWNGKRPQSTGHPTPAPRQKTNPRNKQTNKQNRWMKWSSLTVESTDVLTQFHANFVEVKTKQNKQTKKKKKRIKQIIATTTPPPPPPPHTHTQTKGSRMACAWIYGEHLSSVSTCRYAAQHRLSERWIKKWSARLSTPPPPPRPHTQNHTNNTELVISVERRVNLYGCPKAIDMSGGESERASERERERERGTTWSFVR